MNAQKYHRLSDIAEVFTCLVAGGCGLLFMLMVNEIILCWDFAHVASIRNFISVFCFMSSLLL